MPKLVNNPFFLTFMLCLKSFLPGSMFLLPKLGLAAKLCWRPKKLISRPERKVKYQIINLPTYYKAATLVQLVEYSTTD